MGLFGDLLVAIWSRDLKAVKASASLGCKRPQLLAGSRTYLDFAVAEGHLPSVKALYHDGARTDLLAHVICCTHRGNAPVAAWLINECMRDATEPSRQAVIAAVLYCAQYGWTAAARKIDLPRYYECFARDPDDGFYFTSMRTKDNKIRKFLEANLDPVYVKEERKHWESSQERLLRRDEEVYSMISSQRPLRDILSLYASRPYEADWLLLNRLAHPACEALSLARERSLKRGLRPATGLCQQDIFDGKAWDSFSPDVGPYDPALMLMVSVVGEASPSGCLRAMERSYDINGQNYDRQNALWDAAFHGAEEVFRDLIRHGCDPYIRDIRGRSLLDSFLTSQKAFGSGKVAALIQELFA